MRELYFQLLHLCQTLAIWLKFSKADVCLRLRFSGKFICQCGSSFLYHSNLTHCEDSPQSKHKNVDGKHLSFF